MTRDVIIGACTNYSWDHIKYWVNSINKSGFDGIKIVVAFTIHKATVDKLIEAGFSVIIVGKESPDKLMYIHQETRVPIHVERFFHIWHTLNMIDEPIRYVVTTDMKDVVFQANPIFVMRHILDLDDHNLGIVAAGECLKYKDEAWGRDNFERCFGPFFYETFKENEIYNVGTIAGRFQNVKDLCLQIFQMSLNRPIPIVDQAVFNFLLYNEPYKSTTLFTKPEDGWSTQAGTTADPRKIEEFRINHLHPNCEPILNEFGIVFPGEDDDCPITIVHQWDRVPAWAGYIEATYG